MTMKYWILASRPKTLPAAIMPVIVGSAFAKQMGFFDIIPATICLIFSMLIQIGTNFANDYYDFKKGADTETRIGPQRAVAAGWIQPTAMKNAMIVIFLMAFIVGLALIIYGGWWMLLIGLLSIISGITYTGGPYPLGYNGWGDIFVFVFFGVIAVNCTFFLQAGIFSTPVIISSFAIGALTTNILVVNNYRDVGSDLVAGKKTLAVKFGRKFAYHEYQVLFLIALILPIYLWRLGFSWLILLPVMLWPYSLKLRKQLKSAKNGADYNDLLAKTAFFLIIYGLLLSTGIMAS